MLWEAFQTTWIFSYKVPGLGDSVGAGFCLLLHMSVYAFVWGFLHFLFLFAQIMVVQAMPAGFFLAHYCDSGNRQTICNYRESYIHSVPYSCVIATNL